MYRKLIYFVAAIAVSASCDPYHGTEYREVHELAVDQRILEKGDGTSSTIVNVYSNGIVDVELMQKDVDWVQIDKTVIEGDGELTIDLYSNPDGAYRRMCSILLTLREHGLTDTIVVKQNGVVPYLSCPAPYVNADGKESVSVEFPIETNAVTEDMISSVTYLGFSEDWIEKVTVEEEKVVMVLSANTSSITRRAKCTVGFLDGWNEPQNIELFVTQSNSEGQLGTEVTFMEIMAFGDHENNVIEDDFILKGIVTSDWRSSNMEHNPMVDYNVVDSLVSRRTAYIQAQDGSWGAKLLFDDAAENRLQQGTEVELNLYGIRVLHEKQPDRYTLSGISGWNLMSSMSGTVTPVEIESLSALNDSHVYRLVTINNVEFAFKDGTFADVEEDFSEVMDGWANLLVDNDGKGIYAPVNMNCLWRNSQVPVGRGTVTGILVHNDMPRVGNAGRYQIRVIDMSGFDMEQGSSYTEIYTESAASKPVNIKNLYNWSEAADVVHGGFDFEISTADVDAEVLLLSFDFAGGDKSVTAAQGWPAHWCVRYSVDGGVTWKKAASVVDGAAYVHLRGMPWVRGYNNGQWYHTSVQTSMGPVQNAFSISDADVFGKERVMLRLCPYDKTLVGLVLDWEADMEVNLAQSTMDVDVNVKFGSISVRYR